MELQASIRLMIAMIMNQSIPSGRAFDAPFLLLERLSVPEFDLPAIEKSGPEALLAVMSARPALHRFPKAMTRNLYEAVTAINHSYEGDPRKLWEGKTPADIMKSLRSLRGIGEHKAIQWMMLLDYLGEIPKPPDEYLCRMAESCPGFCGNIKNEVHRIIDAV